MNRDDDPWAEQLRVRAWYCIFKGAQAAANQASLIELRTLLMTAIEAVDRAEEATHGA